MDFAALLEFDTDDPSFARGFEAGRLWSILRHFQAAGELVALDAQPFHASNAEMMLRMLEALGIDELAAEFTADPEWMLLRVVE